MGAFDRFKASPFLRPSLNIGCLFDIPTGRYYTGKHGESILSGGLQLVTGVVGRGNQFKSTLSHFFTLRALDRYRTSKALFYDCEPPAMSPARIHELARFFPSLSGLDLTDEGRAFFTDCAMMIGNQFFDELKQAGEERINKDNIKANTMLTPFIDPKTQQYVSTQVPFLNEIDSISMMPVEAILNQYDENEIGESGMNNEAMNSGRAKTQLLMQLPTFTTKTQTYMIITAHVDDEFDMGGKGKAPNPRKLVFLKDGKVKGAGSKFSFVTNNCWEVSRASVFFNDTTKAPEYPRDGEDTLVGDTDLQIIQVKNLRAKNGPSGMPFSLVLSQRDGIHVGLSELEYLKKFKSGSDVGFGMGGHSRGYYLELLPDVSMQRTTVRGKLDSSYELRRAMEITSEICQLRNHMYERYAGILCTPKELYADLKAKGYDWGQLLNTRGYWVPVDQEESKPFLSTLDLLKMRAGLYTPYWK